MSGKRKLVSSVLILLSFFFLYVSWIIYGKAVDISIKNHKVTGIFCDRCNAAFSSDIPGKCTECGRKAGTVNVVFDRCRNCGSRFSRDNYCTKCGERLLVNIKREELSLLEDAYNKNAGSISKNTMASAAWLILSCIAGYASAVCARKKRTSKKKKKKTQH